MDGDLTPPSKRSYFPWLLLAITIALGVSAFFFFFLNRETIVPASWGTAGGARNGPVDWFNAIQGALVVPIAASVFGTLIVTRRPRHRVGWLLILIGLVSAGGILSQEWALYGYRTNPDSVPGWSFAAWVTNWIWVILTSSTLLMLAIFPDGMFLSRRWQVLISVLFLFFGLPLLIGAAIETPMSSAFQIPNPFVKDHLAGPDNALFNVGVPFMPLTALAVLWAVIARFRQRQERERQQIKWLLAGVVLFATLVVVGLALSFGFNNELGEVMVNAAILAPLVGIGVALLRHQLYDIDIIIRRTLVYTAVSLVLVLVYLGSVILLQQLFRALVGETSDAAIVVSTLAIAALFNPLRRRIQDFIDRRFYRRKYDAEKMLATFNTAVRNEVDLEQLTTAMLSVVEEAVQPAHVSLWLRRSGDERSDRLSLL